MLPKRNRADRKGVEQIFKSGAFINSNNLSFKFILPHSNQTQISFIVPKTVSKKAVERNTLRRAGYNAIKKYINEFPTGLIGVFIFKKVESNIVILEHEIKNIIKKIQYKIH